MENLFRQLYELSQFPEPFQGNIVGFGHVELSFWERRGPADMLQKVEKTGVAQADQNHNIREECLSSM